ADARGGGSARARPAWQPGAAAEHVRHAGADRAARARPARLPAAGRAGARLSAGAAHAGADAAAATELSESVWTAAAGAHPERTYGSGPDGDGIDREVRSGESHCETERRTGRIACGEPAESALDRRGGAKGRS